MQTKEWTPLATAAGIGAGLVFAGAAIARAVSTVAGLREDAAPASAGDGGEHVPTDLMGGRHPDGSARVPIAFRPDPTAPVPADERDAFAPALGAPTLMKGQADDIPRRSAEASSDGMGTVGGLEAVTASPRVGNTPQAPRVG